MSSDYSPQDPSPKNKEKSDKASCVSVSPNTLDKSGDDVFWKTVQTFKSDLLKIKTPGAEVLGGMGKACISTFLTTRKEKE